MNRYHTICFRTTVILVLNSVLCLGFAYGAEPSNAKPVAASSAKVAKDAAVSSGLSLLEIMRAIVQPAGDGIWAVQSNEKLSDQEWLLVDQDSIALAAAAYLISQPGLGPLDKTWVANANWKAWAADLKKTAFEIRAAAKTKDIEAMSNGADHLIEICQDCHNKYRPEIPTDGVVRYPFYPKRELEKK